MKSTLVIITGHPGSGKTTLARRLSTEYRIPYISKDAIKERIFDALGSKDKAWSLKVSAAAHRIMDDGIIQQLRCGGSIIVESNFKPDVDSERFGAFIHEYGAACVQILCHADGDTLFARWQARIAAGSRHEGHVEAVSLDQIRHDLQQPYAPLRLPGRCIAVTTEDPVSIPPLFGR